MRSIKPARGFSLLELVVAITILALSLGIMYQAVGGATRNVRTDMRYAYAVELARSLLADNARVPVDGTQLRGETTGGFAWQVSAEPVVLDQGTLEPGVLQWLDVAVRWSDGDKRREVLLNSVVEGFAE